MSIARSILFAVFLVVGFTYWGCQKSEPITTVNSKDNIPFAYVDADGSHQLQTRDTSRNRYPHMKMEGGAITLNDKCPVRKAPLNLRLPALFVNSQPIGFC